MILWCCGAEAIVVVKILYDFTLGPYLICSELFWVLEFRASGTGDLSFGYLNKSTAGFRDPNFGFRTLEFRV